MKIPTLESVTILIEDCLHATAPTVDEGYPLIRTPNIGRGRLDLNGVFRVTQETYEQWTRRAVPQDADLILAREAPAGNVAIVKNGQRICLGQRTVLIRPNAELVDPDFLCYYLLAPKQQASLLSGATGVTAPHVNMKDIRRLPMPDLPELTTQIWLGKLLSAYDDLIENNRRRMALVEEAARLLYQQWFTRGRFPGHENAKIQNAIPEGWEKKTLAELCSEGDGIQTGPFGSQLHQSDYTEQGVPVVMPKDIIDFRISADDIARIPEELADKLGRHRMKSGDTVYGRRGDIGRRAFISSRQEGWLCGTGSLRLRPNPSVINPLYFFDALGSPESAGVIANRAKGSTMSNLSAEVLKSVPLLVADRSLQDTYSRQVEPMRNLAENLAEQIRNLRVARDLLLPRLMSGEIPV